MNQAANGWPTTLGDGGTALAIELAAGVLQLKVDRAYPPGKPLELTLEAPDGPLQLQGKSAGSKRGDDGRFSVRVKLLSLRREQKARLELLFPAR